MNCNEIKFNYYLFTNYFVILPTVLSTGVFPSMFTKDRIKANEQASQELASDVEAFLANGGKVEAVRDCTVAESYARSRKPYVKKGQDGVDRLCRDHKKMF